MSNFLRENTAWTFLSTVKRSKCAIPIWRTHKSFAFSTGAEVGFSLGKNTGLGSWHFRELQDLLFPYVRFPTELDPNAAKLVDRSHPFDVGLNFCLLFYHWAATGGGAGFCPSTTRLQRRARGLGHQRSVCGYAVEPTDRRTHERLGRRQAYDLLRASGVCRQRPVFFVVLGADT